MTTATKPTFEKKSIWHSELARMGRVLLKFKGDPRESKYPNKPPFVYVQFPDDEQEYCWNLEPECVPAVVAAPKDAWVYVTAVGMTKDEPKGLHVADEAGPILPDSGYAEPADAPKPMDGPPPMFPDETPPKASGADPVAVAASNTIMAVQLLKDAGIEVDPTPIYSTHYIQASRR